MNELASSDIMSIVEIVYSRPARELIAEKVYIVTQDFEKNFCLDDNVYLVSSRFSSKSPSSVHDGNLRWYQQIYVVFWGVA